MKNFAIIPRKESGFTAVEILITIIVAALFTITFYQLFITINQASSSARQRAVASDIAYANLRRYASAGSSHKDWFTCSTASGSSNDNDLSVNNNATGTVLMSGTNTSTTVGPTISLTDLPGPVTYTVKALAIFGCAGTSKDKPIRVESIITYGPQNITIKHDTLVAYQ